MYCDWKEDYELGIESIDAQHKELFRQVKKLQEGMEAGDGFAVMKTFLSELIEDSKAHFIEEEALMETMGFPEANLTAHSNEHHKLLITVSEFRKEFESKRKVMNRSMIDFLIDWLTAHIIGTDRQYAVWLKVNCAGTELAPDSDSKEE